MKRTDVDTLFTRLSALNPHPTTELNYQSPFELLIAVMLSAQSTDKRVNQVTAVLFTHANTPEAMLQLGESGLKPLLRSIGLFNSKTRAIIRTCAQLITQHGSQVPNHRAALEALPGVGRKTANVILNTAFHQPTIAVDTHIFRVANRTGLACGNTPLAVEQQLLAIISDRFKNNAHHWLILHGRYVCTARKPRCSQCVIHDLCHYTLKSV